MTDIRNEWDPASQIPPELRSWGIHQVLGGLLEEEEVWRQRVGDEAYDAAVVYWATKAREVGGERVPMEEVKRRLGLDGDAQARGQEG